MTLTFDSIFLRFGEKTVLSSVYARCETGKITGLLGRNGAGKSCLMRIVFGVMQAEHKSVRIDDAPLRPGYLAARHIAYLPQDYLIPPWLTIRQALRLYQITPGALEEHFADIGDWLDFRPGHISGGWRRIVEALMVLLSPSPFCLLDEPFTGMMPIHVAKMKSILKTVKATKGIFLTDHMYHHVMDIADDLMVLANGKTYPVRSREDLVRKGYISGR